MEFEESVTKHDESIEDGEVLSDVEYEPLERPAELIERDIQPSTTVVDDEPVSDEPSSSDTDSDDSDRLVGKSKRTKAPRRNAKFEPTAKKKRYDVWCSKAQEDSLAETMNSVDVSALDRSRAVETYNIPQRLEYKNNNKRTLSERENIKLRLGKRNADTANNVDCKPRYLAEAEVTEANTIAEVAQDLARKMMERAVELLEGKIEVIGIKKALQLFNETRKIEADGGMLIMNQQRRRTSGGVFFTLLKFDDEITPEQKERMQTLEKKLFATADTHQRSRKSKKKKKKGWKERKMNNLQKSNAAHSSANNDSEHEMLVTNPPPSPATDGKDMNSSADSMSDSSDDEPKTGDKKTTGGLAEIDAFDHLDDLDSPFV